MKATAALVILLSCAPVATAQVMPSEANRRAAIERFWSGQELLQAERWERAAIEFRAAISAESTADRRALRPRRSADGPSPLHQRRVGISGMPRGRPARAHVARESPGGDRPPDLGGSRPDPRHDSPAPRLRTCARVNWISTCRRCSGTVRAWVCRIEPPAPVLLALGSAHFRNGDRVRAEYYWREATRVDDELGEAWNNLAAMYAATTRRLEAEDAVARAERAGYRVNPRLKEEIAALGQQ